MLWQDNKQDILSYLLTQRGPTTFDLRATLQKRDNLRATLFIHIYYVHYYDVTQKWMMRCNDAVAIIGLCQISDCCAIASIRVPI